MLRVTTLIVVRAPYDAIAKELQQLIHDVALQLGVSSLQLASEVHMMWVDESLSLLIALMRAQPSKLPLV